MAPRTSATTLHIGEVAQRVGLSLRTVRYYEEQGLFEPAGRTEGRLTIDSTRTRLEACVEAIAATARVIAK